MGQVMQKRFVFASLCLALAVVGCGSKKPETATPGSDRSTSFSTSGAEEGDKNPTDQCAAGSNREISEYDTSGDSAPDVRKVFLRVGEGALARLVLICRETDVNADGKKDVIRYYNNDGDPIREEADRDFNGKMDQVTYFEGGEIMRQEFDSQGDGKVDTKLYFEKGKPLRAERDLKARSTADKWRPDRWEYYEDGRMVRMGTDLDGDGKVDRWDRDAATRRELDLGSTSSEATES
jgi:hypothetical protein